MLEIKWGINLLLSVNMHQLCIWCPVLWSEKCCFCACSILLCNKSTWYYDWIILWNLVFWTTIILQSIRLILWLMITLTLLLQCVLFFLKSLNRYVEINFLLLIICIRPPFLIWIFNLLDNGRQYLNFSLHLFPSSPP